MTWCFSSESCQGVNTVDLNRRLKDATHPFPQIIQNLDLDESLVVETLLVPDDLDSHGLPGAMVATMKHLPEGALTQGVDDLVPKR